MVITCDDLHCNNKKKKLNGFLVLHIHSVIPPYSETRNKCKRIFFLVVGGCKAENIKKKKIRVSGTLKYLSTYGRI